MKDYKEILDESYRLYKHNQELETLIGDENSCGSIDAMMHELYIGEITQTILNENALYSFLFTTLPDVLAIICKYNGKRVGERTKEKIRDECKEKYNVYVYFSHPQYRAIELTIRPIDREPWNYSDCEMHCKDYNRNLWDTDGKFNMPTDPDMFYSFNAKKYIENPKEQAEKIANAYKEMYTQFEIYDESCKNLNDLLPTLSNHYYVQYPKRLV